MTAVAAERSPRAATPTAATTSFAAAVPLPGPTPEQRRERTQLRLVKGLLLSLVLLQRVALPVPGGAVPLLLLLGLVVVAVGLERGLITIDWRRAALLLAALGCCLVTGLGAQVRGLPDNSILSLVYLLATYAPFAFVLRGATPALVQRSVDYLSRLGVAVAVVALVQLAIQPVGFAYSDLPADVLPHNLLLHTFNTSYPIVYGSPLYKSNAWVFLEPSFCSQFLGLALVARLAAGRRGWPLLLLTAGIVATVAGTGMIVVGIGVVVIAARRGLRALKVLAAPLIGAILLAVATPLGSVLASRATETSSKQSSGSLRFVQPFQIVGGVWLRHMSTLLFGSGPGSSERLGARLGAATDLQQPVPIKLAYDYGGIATVVFILCLLWIALAQSTTGPIGIALVASWIILNSALLLPAVTLPLWLLTCALSPAWRPPGSLPPGGLPTRTPSTRTPEPTADPEPDPVPAHA